VNLTSKRKCPNCGLDSKHSTLEVKAKNPAENLTAKQLEDFFVGFRKDQCFFTYYRCACGLLWCPEYFHQGALNEIYKNIPENNLVSGEKDSKKTQIGYTDLIFKMNQVVSPVLEIGADIGNLVGEIVDRKPSIQAYAVEPNQKVITKLASRLGSKNNIYPDLFDFPNSIKPKLIIAIHVIDHLIEPRKFIEKLDSISSTEAELFIVVHNEASLLRKMLKNKWAPFCLQHPQIFSVKTLTSLLKSVGFLNVHTRKTSNWISPKHAGKLLESISIIPTGISSLLPNAAFPLKLGNFALSAQKRYVRIE
jgi:hypothetical protein